MSRQLTIATREMGKVDLYLIYDYGGTWEEEWKPLQEHSVGALLSKVTHDTIEHAIRGFSRPLVKSLGLLPRGLLHKLPYKTCANTRSCSLYIEKNCHTLAKSMPWCWEPEGVEASARARIAELVRLWREAVYVVVVEEPINAGR